MLLCSCIGATEHLPECDYTIMEPIFQLLEGLGFKNRVEVYDNIQYPIGCQWEKLQDDGMTSEIYLTKDVDWSKMSVWFNKKDKKLWSEADYYAVKYQYLDKNLRLEALGCKPLCIDLSNLDQVKDYIQ